MRTAPLSPSPTAAPMPPRLAPETTAVVSPRLVATSAFKGDHARLLDRCDLLLEPIAITRHGEPMGALLNAEHVALVASLEGQLLASLAAREREAGLPFWAGGVVELHTRRGRTFRRNLKGLLERMEAFDAKPQTQHAPIAWISWRGRVRVALVPLRVLARLQQLYHLEGGIDRAAAQLTAQRVQARVEAV